MTWNFRLVKHTNRRLVWYAVHEVFYNDAGKPFTMTEDPVDITDKSPAEVRNYLEMIQRDIQRLPILDMRRVKWAKPPWKEPVKTPEKYKRARTPLERAVDLEMILKGKDVVKDFDESQVLHVPAKRFRKRRKKKS